ncbi:uncharacterized protein [Eucyclogobius newberryi]|uniref:uncharacterized protein n=1 Tax=Eucyclogobius newberryi TaxID=166745 RepID=UPI003B5BF027
MRSQMESYEQFCLQTLALLQDQGGFKKLTPEPLCSLKPQSVIVFHGRPILPPRLTAEQRRAMCNYREQAVQKEVQRQSQQRGRPGAPVRDLLHQAQTKPGGVVGKAQSGKTPTICGYTLVTDSPGLTKDSGCDYLAASFSDTSIVSCQKEEEVEKSRTEQQFEEEEEEEEEDKDDISLDSLLKKSREYVKQEQKMTAAPDSSPLDTTNSTIQMGFSLRHSPVGQPKTQSQPFYDPIPQQPASFSPTSPDQHSHLPLKDFCPSRCAPNRRPRPISTGNIHFSFPIEPADLIPRGPGRPADVGVADRDMFLGTARSSHHRASLGQDFIDDVENCQSNQWSTSPKMEPCSPDDVICSPNGHRGSSQFRRRCHTLDSQPQSGRAAAAAACIDRSQERVPRFMAGVTWLGPNRRLPTNQSHNTECPSTSKPSVTSDSPNAPRKAPDAQTRAEGAQRPAQALEDKQRQLEDEHALHMSQLLAEQEREQQRLLLEHDQAERRLKEQWSRRPLSADASGWSYRLGSESCPIISPSCPRLSPSHTPSERSRNLGFPNPAISPSVLSPITTWAPNWTGYKPGTRLSEVMTLKQQRGYCHICAITRGFLTRRLLKTEKVKQLRQTVVDTHAFICSLQTEAPQKRLSNTTQDFSLQERVRAQLRAALYDVHDIFFQMPLSQRLALLQQERELRLERKLREMEKTKSSKDKVLSAATQRSIDRKKRVGESPAQTKKMQQKPKSPTTNRVLKPSQGQNSPAMGQLNRQGSWYKKTPEERVRRADHLKKQHSLG